MKQQLDADAPRENVSAPVRFVLLQRTIDNALRLTRTRAPLPQQIIGWGVVAAIFLAAVACWGVVISVGLLIYGSF